MDSTIALNNNESSFRPSAPIVLTSSTANNNNSTTDSKQISKLILRTALEKANVAVQRDSSNDVLGAITAYKEALTLLERVLLTVEKENDRRRLQDIHTSYSERIGLLSSIPPKEETSSIDTASTASTSSSNSSIHKDDSKPEAATTPTTSTTFTEVNNTPQYRPVSNPSEKEELLPGLHPPPPKMTQTLQASKSTPTTPIQQTRFDQEFDIAINEDYNNNNNDLIQHYEQQPLPQPPQLQAALPQQRPPRSSSRMVINTKLANSHSSVSSYDDISSETSSIIEQPIMALPSLKQQVESTANTPTPTRTTFRARTSSLPKSPPFMRRSTSMSTVETLGSPITSTFANTDPSVITVAEVENDIAGGGNSNSTFNPLHHLPPPSTPPTPSTTSPTTTQQYFNSTSSNRSIMNRPSVGSSLGSMRRKATHRLSIESFARNKDRNDGNYNIYIKEQIMSQNNTIDTTLANDESEQEQQIHRQQIHQQNQLEASQSKPLPQPHPGSSNNTATTGATTNFAGQYLKLILAIEKSMTEGAHITQRLYIPRNLWHQPNVRLSSIDIKLSACESLLTAILELENWSHRDDPVRSAKFLEGFESSVEQLQSSLLKKLKRASSNNAMDDSSSSSINSNTSNNSQMSASNSSMIHSNNSNSNNNRDSLSSLSRLDSGKKTQSFMSWGTKITRQMNAFSLTKTEDQFKNYIETLQKLFSKIHILELWLNHYNAERKKKPVNSVQHEVVILKLIRICNTINTVVGSFVVRDITVLLAKWLKRGGSWVNE